jgi:hypothetical protein
MAHVNGSRATWGQYEAGAGRPGCAVAGSMCSISDRPNGRKRASRHTSASPMAPTCDGDRTFELRPTRPKPAPCNESHCDAETIGSLLSGGSVFPALHELKMSAGRLRKAPEKDDRGMAEIDTLFFDRLGGYQCDATKSRKVANEQPSKQPLRIALKMVRNASRPTADWNSDGRPWWLFSGCFADDAPSTEHSELLSAGVLGLCRSDFPAQSQ